VKLQTFNAVGSSKSFNKAPKMNCKIHGTKLKRTKVPISYGMPGYDKASAVREQLFPNAKSYVLGGCVIDFFNPSHQDAMVCEECREAEASWRKEND
jgi:hypothetical protein